MRPEEWFAVALRAIGVVVFLYGAGFLFDSALLSLGYFNQPDPSPSYYMIVGIFYVIVGLYLLKGAPHIVRFSYPREEEEEEEEQNVDKNGTNQQDS